MAGGAMSSDRMTPQAPDRREGAEQLMNPEPSTSSPRGEGNRNSQRMTNDDNMNQTNGRKFIEIDHTKARIFYISSTPPQLLNSLNGFVVKRVLSKELGNNHKCTRLRSGTLRVEIENVNQARTLKKMKTIHSVEVVTTVPFSSNTVKGVVTHYDFGRMTEDEIVEEMEHLDVVACRKFYKTDRQTRRRIDTNTVCLTFAKTTLPDSICVGYEPRKVRPFVPRPIRCNKCQSYGHSEFACRSKTPICMRCASNTHQITDCQAAEAKCAACEGPHRASDRTCPVWEKECAIIEVKTLQRLSYKEAKAKVEAPALATPTPGVSYSSVVKSSTNTSSTSQTQSMSTAPTKAHKKVDTRIESDFGDKLTFLAPRCKIDFKKAAYNIGEDLYQENDTETQTTETTEEATSPTNECTQHTQEETPMETETTTTTHTVPEDTPIEAETSSTTHTLPDDTPQLNQTLGHRGRSGVVLVNSSQTNTNKEQTKQKKPVVLREHSNQRIPIQEHRNADFDLTQQQQHEHNETAKHMDFQHTNKRNQSPASSSKGGVKPKHPKKGNNTKSTS